LTELLPILALLFAAAAVINILLHLGNAISVEVVADNVLSTVIWAISVHHLTYIVGAVPTLVRDMVGVVEPIFLIHNGSV
jgi:hypothetical protein